MCAHAQHKQEYATKMSRQKWKCAQIDAAAENATDANKRKVNMWTDQFVRQLHRQMDKPPDQKVLLEHFFCH